MTERLHFHFPLSCLGEGNGNPLQCSCLENPRDRGAWWAAVYGVAWGRTRLKRLSSSSSSSLLYNTSPSMMVAWGSCAHCCRLCQWFCHIDKFAYQWKKNFFSLCKDFFSIVCLVSKSLADTWIITNSGS